MDLLREVACLNKWVASWFQIILSPCIRIIQLLNHHMVSDLISAYWITDHKLFGFKFLIATNFLRMFFCGILILIPLDNKRIQLIGCIIVWFNILSKRLITRCLFMNLCWRFINILMIWTIVDFTNLLIEYRWPKCDFSRSTGIFLEIIILNLCECLVEVKR